MYKIMVFSKKTSWCAKAIELIRKQYGDEAVAFSGEVGDPFPKEAETWRGDVIISYLSPWIIPPSVLKHASRFAINFHPGTPGYPGAGCYNFAIYEGAKEYGVTCHYMEEGVDRGKIIAVKTFSMAGNESVHTLKEKSMGYLFDLFKEIMGPIIREEPLPRSGLVWARRPFTRRQLDALCEVTSKMDAGEITKRVRATYYPGAPGPHINLAGYRFTFVGD